MPKIKKHPEHLFSTWLDYRKSIYNENNTAVIEYVNQVVGRNYKANQVSRWKNGDVSIPDNIHKVINIDYAAMLEWLMKQESMLINGCFVNYEKVSMKLKVFVPEKEG